MDIRLAFPALALVVLPAAVTGAGCIRCDCTVPGVAVDFVDADGRPVAVDGVRAWLDGELIFDKACGGCEGVLVPWEGEGPEGGSEIVIEATLGGATFEDTWSTEAPTAGGCCSGFVYMDVVLEVDAP